MTHVATVSINDGQVAADLTDFVALITPDNAVDWDTLWATVVDGGGDIRCYKSDGTTALPREVVSCVVSTKTGEIHVKFTGTLLAAPGADRDIQIHADGASAEPAFTDLTHGRNAAWQNYTAVWHLSEDGTGGSGSIVDSTGNGHEGTPSGWSVSGKVAGPDGRQSALSFDGSSQFIAVSDDPALELLVSGGANCAVQFWSHPDIETAWYAITKKSEWAAYMAGDGANSPRFNTIGGNNTAGLSGLNVTISAWNHITHFIDPGSRIRSYVDGTNVCDVAVTDTSAGTTDNVEIGRGSLDYGDGRLQYARIAKGAQADAIDDVGWLGTEHNNQSAPGTFYTVAEVGGGGVTGTVTLGASSSASFGAVASVTAALLTGAQSTVVFSSVAQVLASWDEAAQSGEVGSSLRNLDVQLSAAAEGNLTLEALISAARAFTAGAQAGESWVKSVQALAGLTSSAEALAQWQGETAGVTSVAITEGSESAAQFLRAAQTLAQFTSGVTADIAAVALAHTVANFGSGAVANESITAQFDAVSALVAGAEAGASWVRQLAGLAALTAGGTAGDTWVYAVQGVTTGAVLEGAEGAAQFQAAAQTAGIITANGVASEAFVGLLSVARSITMGTTAGAAFSSIFTGTAALAADGTSNAIFAATVSQFEGALQAAGLSSAAYIARAETIAIFSSGALAGASFSYPDAVGYLVIGAITIQAALLAHPEIVPALDGHIDIDPV